jgi:hypothetical protein
MSETIKQCAGVLGAVMLATFSLGVQVALVGMLGPQPAVSQTPMGQAIAVPGEAQELVVKSH